MPDDGESAAEQFERILSFFPRLDAKTTAVLGIDIAMLGFLAVNAPPYREWSWLMLVAILPITLVGVSLFQIYRCSFPHLDGGHDSLVYFREIAKRTEARYIQEFYDQTTEARTKDLLGQIWRNSEILRIKFDALRLAHVYLVAALLPWLAALFVFSAISTSKEVLFH